MTTGTTSPARWRRLFGRAVLVVALAACSVLGLSLAATAKNIPLPPLPSPQVPSQLQPALGLVAPVVSPECGNLALAAALVIPALGGDVPGGLPFAPAPLFAPILAICGAVPVPGEELECQGDSTITALASEGITDVLGGEGGLLGKVFDLGVFGQTVEEVQVLQAVAPSQLQGVDLSSLLANALKCTKVAAVKPILGGTPPALGSAAPLVPLSPVGAGPVVGAATDSGLSVGISTGGSLATEASSAPAVNSAPPHRAALAPPVRTGLASQLMSPTSTVAQGGAIVGFLLLLSGAVAVFLRGRRAVQAAPEEGA
jgi:hypothetical protein